jgi:predicted acyltransferase
VTLTAQQPARLASLDAFRGAVIASMILVNSPGDPNQVYTQLAHVEWNGWTFTDLIAPAFLWIIGVTTVLSLARRLESAPSRMAILRHVVRRSALLFLVGLGLAVLPALLPPDLSALQNVKLMGILQRIAICYCLASAISLWGTPRAAAVWAVILLATYWLLLVAVPLPGGETASLEPGRNLAQVIDRRLLGPRSEGTHTLLTIMTVTATVLIGTLAGRLLHGGLTVGRGALRLLAGGVLLVGLGLLLSRWMPINRRLWTPSFCVFTAGVAMAVFAGFHWVLDGKRIRRGFGLLIAYGANPILLFVLSELVRMLAQGKGFTDGEGTWRSLWTIGYEMVPSIAGPDGASLVFGLAYTLLFGLLAVFMYRRRWIVKI